MNSNVITSAKQTSLPFDDPELEGKIFELYVKDDNREFMRHDRFIIADSIDEAEDIVIEVLPDYWKTMSVRPVDMNHVWKTYESLHFSYSICKSILGI